MNLNEYQSLALRTLTEKDKKQNLTLGVMGLAGESGECIDLVKKHVFHDHPLAEQKLKEELGDVLWYLAVTAHSMGVSLDEVAEINVQKLKTRYPNGFTSADSIARVDYNKK